MAKLQSVEQIEVSNHPVLGMHRAIVVDDNDTKGLGRVKILIYGLHSGVVPDRFPSNDAREIDVNLKEAKKRKDLPWAIPALPIYHASPSTGITGGMFSVPKTGQQVWVFFDQGNFDNPIYFAMAPSGPSWTRTRSRVKNVLEGIESAISSFLSSVITIFAEKPSVEVESIDKVKDNVIFGTPNGTLVIIGHEKGKERICIVDGNTLMQRTGDGILDYTDGDKNEIAEGDEINIVGGNYSLGVTGNITIETVTGTVVIRGLIVAIN